MDKRPLVSVSCAWIVGVSLLSFFSPSLAKLAVIGFLFLLLGLWQAKHCSSYLLLFCIIALVGGNFARYTAQGEQATELPLFTNIESPLFQISGRIKSEIDVDGNLVRFNVQVQTYREIKQEKWQENNEMVIVRIKLKQKNEQLQADEFHRGDQVLLQGRFELPIKASNFNSFDYRNYLLNKHIHRQFTLDGINQLSLLPSTVPFLLRSQRTIDDLRRRMDTLHRQLYTKKDAGFMSSLVVGIRQNLDPMQYESFAQIGLTHILAISGLHVGIFIFIFLRIGCVLKLTRERSVLLTIVVLPFYTLLTGAAPSTIRASLMAIIKSFRVKMLISRGFLRD